MIHLNNEFIIETMITNFKYVRVNPMTIQEYASIVTCQTCLDSLDFYRFVVKMLLEHSLKNCSKTYSHCFWTFKWKDMWHMEILQCSKHYPSTHETILNVIIIGNTSLEKMVGDGLIFGYVSRRWTFFENGHFWKCDVENWLFEKMVLWIWPICWIRF